jgi:hypothetical protein
VAPGKRLNTADPLTEHDVAARLDKAALRTVHILMEMRQLGMMEPVKHSRYLTNTLSMLAAELQLWDVEPQENWSQEAGETPATS